MRGPVGKMGPAGEPGVPGKAGVDGKVGPVGPTGPRGPAGKSALEVHTWGGSSEQGDVCAFPFDYKGVMYETCTTDGHDNPWCYTTADKSRWGHCVLNVETIGGTALEGETCHFPFMYKGSQYSSCIADDYKQPWCFVNKEQSRWGLCKIPAIEGTSEEGDYCKTRCTTAWHTQPWCFVDNKNSRWGHCEFEVAYS